MECNKQEAIRAKEIAEIKMQSKDYRSAHKFALKAQVLYPDLENISQILTVCEVHCSSEKNIFGNEKDWYSILKIEHTADETSIKKQYKKLALLLHPDKNSFSGATDAFKLIGEAQRVLLDSNKRKSHDFNRRASRSFVPVRPQHQHPNKNSNAAASTCKQNKNRMNANDSFPQGQPQTSSAVFKETFWTACPFCCIRYQYYKDLINRLLQCQQCKKSFTALEVKGRTAPSEGNHRMSDYLKKENTSNPKSEGVNSKRKHVSENGTTSGQTKASEAKKPVGSPKKEDKAGKRKTESSGTTESESSADSVETLEDELSKKNVEDDLSKKNVEDRRRSSRSKSNISYKVYMSDGDDDDFEGGPRKKMKQEPQPEEDDASQPIENLSSEESQQSKKPVDSEENTSQTVKEDNDEKTSAETSSDEMDDTKLYKCPDPQFNDFDNILRKEDCFEVGQLWACYDDVDAMPRFYCRIVKVFSPGFKLRIMWLEPDPSDDEEKPGNDELPVSCGTFKRGNYEFTEELLMFSHLIPIEKGSKSDRFKVYPRKGETWALFKNWEPNTVIGNKFEYEFVEVLSDYDVESGVSVAPLEKVQGFTCLFIRTTTNSFEQVVPSELCRFSHFVPSFKMSGKEREGVPAGCFELDPAAVYTPGKEDDS